MMRIISLIVSFAVLLIGATLPARARDVREGDFTIKDFRFSDGTVFPVLHLHYRTLGTLKYDANGRAANAVLLLHAAGLSGAQFLQPQFADELFGPGQPLDVSRFFVVMPDGIGNGASSKPSDGLRMGFPHYDYGDMIEAQRRLLLDGLKVDHLRLILGTSMGCMETFQWGATHPGFSDALMPIACLPAAVSGLDRAWRKMAMDAIRADPAWMDGNYKTQPAQGLAVVADLLFIVSSAPVRMRGEGTSPAAIDKALEEHKAGVLKYYDANDLIYRLDASRNYDPSSQLGALKVPVMWVNSADDFVNPSYLGIAEKKVKALKRGHYVLIPASEKTHGHSSHSWAVLWKDRLSQLLKESGG